MSTSPSSWGRRPARSRNSVDLPTPFAPTSPTCWPGETLNETSENSSSPPGWAYARLETTTWDTVAQPRATALARLRGADGVGDAFESVALEEPQQPAQDLLDHVRPAVDQARVDLHDGRAEPQLAVRVLRGRHAARRHQRVAAVGADDLVERREDRVDVLLHRPAADRAGHALERVAGVGELEIGRLAGGQVDREAGDERMAVGDRDDLAQHAGIAGRLELEDHGDARVARGEAPEQRVDPRQLVEEVAVGGGVRTAQVERDVVGAVLQQCERRGVVLVDVRRDRRPRRVVRLDE